jgi:hypothetical protein
VLLLLARQVLAALVVCLCNLANTTWLIQLAVLAPDVADSLQAFDVADSLQE